MNANVTNAHLNIVDNGIADRDENAVIPPRKNAKLYKDATIISIEANELLKIIKQLGRTIWKKWSGLHQKIWLETKIHCFKLLTDKLSARCFQSQVNEIDARIAVLNKFIALGRPPTRVIT